MWAAIGADFEICEEKILARMAIPRTGIINQLGENLPGFASRTDATLRKFAQRVITNQGKLEKVLSRLREIRILPHDGTSAKLGNRNSIARIRQALVLIAEAKTGQPILDISTRQQGQEIFGFRMKPIPSLSPLYHRQMLDSKDGILHALRFLPGFDIAAGEALITFAKKQVTEHEKQRKMVEALQNIGLLNNDGNRAWVRKKALPMDRIHEALLVIAEAKTGSRPSRLTTASEGREFLGLPPVKKD